MANNRWGALPGPVDAPWNYGRAGLPGGLTFTQISGGLFDTADIGSGDSQDTLTVGGVSIIDSAQTFLTDAATSAHKIARHINSADVFPDHDWWVSIAVADSDHVRIWPKDGSATVTATVAGTDTGYTPVYGDVNTTQAFAAAVRKPSGNYGDDVFPGTAMYQVGFDFKYISQDSDWDIDGLAAAELMIFPEDQIVRVYWGGEGYIRVPSAAWFTIPILGAMQGHVNMFMQAEAATNMHYMIVVH
jgi:hypothetical protein